MVSPYLKKPLRTLDEALRDCGRRAVEVGDCGAAIRSDAEPSRPGDVLVQLLLSRAPGSGLPGNAPEAATESVPARRKSRGRRAA